VHKHKVTLHFTDDAVPSHSSELDSSTAQCRTEQPPCRMKIPCYKLLWMPTAQVLRSNAANIGERKTWTQSEFCTLQNFVRGQE